MGVLHTWNDALSRAEQGGFDQAFKYLEGQEIILESSTSYFNLGVLASSINELPLAKYYFYKSFLADFINFDAYSKLQLVSTLLEKTTQVSDDILVTFLLLFKSGIFVLFFLLVIILFLVICFLKGSKKFKEKPIICGGCAIFLFLIFSPNLVDLGMVKKNAIEHEGPSRIFKKDKLMKAGSIIFLGMSNNKFIKIYGVSESSVWLHRDKIERF